MFSRLSRFFSRSKRQNNTYQDLSGRSVTLLPSDHPSFFTSEKHHRRRLSSSSGHSSSCSIEPERAPSFLEIVCNDSQPVYCMETVPLYKPSSLPPGTRKANSLYESEHDGILRERMRVNALETEENQEPQKRRKRLSYIREEYVDSRGAHGIQQRISNQHIQSPRRTRRQSLDLSRLAEPPSTDCYYGLPGYQDRSQY